MEGEGGFVKDNVTRYYDFTNGEIETPKIVMMGWIVEEDTRSGTRCMFIRCENVG